MTSIIKLEALSGVYGDSPLCYLLQVDEFHFLLDCGWDESFDMEYIDKLRRHVGTIDAVLLSYADIPHLGALPYLVGRCGLNCPVYATVPVYKMGQMFMYDWYQSHQNIEDFNLFSLDDVDAAFDKVQQVKYSQNVSLKGKGHGLQITPLPAGHMLGGTIWRITKMGEEEIIYAVDFNHKKERHLNGCQFETINRPSLLITDCFNATYKQERRKQRDEQLLTTILQTLRSGGNVLIVIDTAGRVLELAQLLDTLWHNVEAGLTTYSLVMMSNVAYNVVEFAKSQVEWMSDKIMKSFQEGRNNPFQFRHVQLCHSIAELARVRSPKVVLASNCDMESGYSRELFLEWCGNPRNSVILTCRAAPGTLAHNLLQNIQTNTRQVIVEVKKRVRLEGAELDEFHRKRQEKESEAARKRLELQRRNSRHTKDTEGSGEDSDDDEPVFTGQMAPPTPGAPKPEGPSHNDVLYRFEQQQKSSFFKQQKKLYPIYPFVEDKIKWDEYGEIINPEDYMIIETAIPGSQHQQVKTEDGTAETTEWPLLHPEVSDIPTKCVRYIQGLDVHCTVTFIDFEGRCDAESIKKILGQIKPKQLILVHGSPEATLHLANYCRNTAGMVQGRVFAPQLYEIVDATIESHIYQVTIADPLMSSLEFQPVKDAHLAWVDSRIQMRKHAVIEGGSSDVMITAKKEEASSNLLPPPTDGIPTLDCILNSDDVPTHQAVFINDPKLSDLKQTLVLSGFAAEFSGGVLYVNNVLSIKRSEPGRFHIEGCACKDFYRIREVLYKQFAIV